MVDRLSLANLNLYRRYEPVPVLPSPSIIPSITSDQKTILTGTGGDIDFAAQIIGKDMPLFIGGQALIGCRIGEGGFITTTDGAMFADFIVTPCMVAVPEATREVRYLHLNGTRSFESSDGGATWAPVATGPLDGVTVSAVKYGSETQLPFSSSTSRYGDRAVPYRSNILIELKNVPLALFANQIPFISAYVYESDSITRQEALERLARWARYRPSEYEMNVSGEDQFWMVVKPNSFIGYMRELQRSVGRNWNILPSDKLRVFENSATVTPITITRDDIKRGSIRFEKLDPNSVPAERSLGFIDVGRDNDFNSVKATQDRFPIPLTASQSTEELDIPIGTTASVASTINEKSVLIDDIGRDRFICTVLPHMMGLQPGDIITPDLDDEIEDDPHRILTLAHMSGNFEAELVAERIRIELLPEGPSITSNGGGATASISVDEEDGVSVTTVTSDQAGEFSIAGGDDAALFTIDPDTGVLEFLTEPDYEDPQDADTNNAYEVIVHVLAGGLAGTQIITVTVNDVFEGEDEAAAPEFLIIF